MDTPEPAMDPNETVEATENQTDSSDDEKGYESDPEKEVELMKVLEAKVSAGTWQVDCDRGSGGRPLQGDPGARS